MDVNVHKTRTRNRITRQKLLLNIYFGLATNTCTRADTNTHTYSICEEAKRMFCISRTRSKWKQHQKRGKRDAQRERDGAKDVNQNVGLLEKRADKAYLYNKLTEREKSDKQS